MATFGREIIVVFLVVLYGDGGVLYMWAQFITVMESLCLCVHVYISMYVVKWS